MVVERDLENMFLVMEFCEQDIDSLIDNMKVHRVTGQMYYDSAVRWSGIFTP